MLSKVSQKKIPDVLTKLRYIQNKTKQKTGQGSVVYNLKMSLRRRHAGELEGYWGHWWRDKR